RVLSMVAAAGVAGCTLMPGMDEERPAPPARPITCTAGPDCEIKWSRALAWVTQNSTKIAIQSETVIQATGPTDSGSYPVYTVNRTAGANGTYEILFDCRCNGTGDCGLLVSETRARFEKFVTE